jgi:hypothetical protein
MTTFAQLKTKVRNAVKDNSTNPASTPKVSDEELLDYATYALADYSRHFPIEKLLVVDPPAQAIARPDDMVPGEKSLKLVEVGSGKFLTRVTLSEGAALPAVGDYYCWRGGQVVLSATPQSAVTLHYHGLHPYPAADEDALSVPLADEELIVTYMAALFHRKLGTVAAKLDRFRESGARDDNPLVLMYDVLMKDYNAKVADRLHRGTVRIRRM